MFQIIYLFPSSGLGMTICSKWGKNLEKIKCNNYEIKKVETFKYLGHKMATNGRVKEEVTERIKKGMTIVSVSHGCSLEMRNT